MKIGVVIPAFNEESSIGIVVWRVRKTLEPELQFRVVVCDNGSQDGTAVAAASAGGEVCTVDRRGYGAACSGGLEHLGEWPDAIVFLDGDGSSRPEEIPLLLQPIRDGEVDLVIGARSAKANMTAPQRWGTRLAVWLINARWGSEYRDMGPFRAIRRESLAGLGMKDRTWGWTLELQILATLRNLRVREVQAAWDPRISGKSKISGTLSGVVRAGFRILWTFLLYAPKRKRRATRPKSEGPCPIN